METNGRLPEDDQALVDLAAARDSQGFLRTLPWPVWLYAGNGAALGAAALLPLLASPVGSGLLTVLVVGLCVFNYSAGFRMGAPFAVPRNRVFRACTALSGVLLTAAVTAGFAGLTGLVWVCAAGTVLSYAVGSVSHFRETRR